MLKSICGFLLLYSVLLCIYSSAQKELPNKFQECQTGMSTRRTVNSQILQDSSTTNETGSILPATHLREHKNLPPLFQLNSSVRQIQSNRLKQSIVLHNRSSVSTTDRSIPKVSFTEHYGLLIDLVPSSIAEVIKPIFTIGSLYPVLSSHLSDLWDFRNYQFSREKWYLSFHSLTHREPLFLQLLSTTRNNYVQKCVFDSWYKLVSETE